MINHARTLLLNRSAAYFEGTPLSEYISPAFEPVTLTRNLQGFRDILFPPGIDKFTENYIAASIMQVLHSPELLPYVLMYDRRYTYDIHDSVLRSMLTSPVSLKSDYDSNCDIIPKYRLRSSGITDPSSFVGEHEWTFSTDTEDTMKMSYSRKAGVIDHIKVTNGTETSDRVPMLGGYISAYFELPTQLLTGKYSFKYSAVVAPVYNLASLNDTVRLYTVQLHTGGGFFTDKGEYAGAIQDLRFTWQYSTEIILALGSLIAAYITQVDKLRSK